MGYKDKIVDLKKAMELRDQFERNAKKVVFTNGCFDLIHLGHISYLEKAKLLGDVLIVGLNSDKSVENIKGKGRPLNGEESRSAVLAGLESVDFVVVFETDTPLELIEKLTPNVLVKGADYKIENIVGAEYVMSQGGEVRTIDFVNGFSSSNIVNKIEGN